jgi:hypothetical protein
MPASKKQLALIYLPIARGWLAATRDQSLWILGWPKG